jgi:hypothetical protein
VKFQTPSSKVQFWLLDVLWRLVVGVLGALAAMFLAFRLAAGMFISNNLRHA